jgi:transcriptional regulator with XRE-family HTH domain
LIEPKASPVLDEFASTLVQGRMSLGITQNELHKRTGLSREAIKGYESGRNKPGAKELKLLCEALQISPNQLLFGSEQPFHPKGELYDFMYDSGQFNNIKLVALFDLLTAKEKESFLFLMHSLILSRHSQDEVTTKLKSIEFSSALMMAMISVTKDVQSGEIKREDVADETAKRLDEFMKNRTKDHKKPG